MKANFGLPDVPYSQVHVEDGDNLAEVMEFALNVRAAYLDAFAQNAPRAQQAAPPPAAAPRTGVRPQARPAAPPAAEKQFWGYCPDHPDVEAVESAPQYQEYDTDERGNQVPAKFYCPGAKNGTGKNHSLWRSKLVQDAVPF